MAMLPNLNASNLSPEGQADLVRMSLRAAGYPNVPVNVRPSESPPVTIGVFTVEGEQICPWYVAWKAYASAGLAVSCWQCFRDGSGDTCRHIINPFAPEVGE